MRCPSFVNKLIVRRNSVFGSKRALRHQVSTGTLPSLTSRHINHHQYILLSVCSWMYCWCLSIYMFVSFYFVAHQLRKPPIIGCTDTDIAADKLSLPQYSSWSKPRFSYRTCDLCFALCVKDANILSRRRLCDWHECRQVHVSYSGDSPTKMASAPWPETKTQSESIQILYG